MFEKDIKMIFLFEITRLKDSFKYQTWRRKMRNQLILMNLWHYVEIENVESNSIVSIFIVAITLEELRKIKIDNFKIVTTMRNRLRYNDKNFLKNEINAKNAWKILKNSFNSFESKMLNDLLIKLWIIILVNNQNATNYARRFKTTMQNIRETIINVSINDNFLNNSSKSSFWNNLTNRNSHTLSSQIIVSEIILFIFWYQLCLLEHD
jgi:L-lactate permease